jgi:phosphatidylinositol phospholipase C, delta
VLAAQSLPLPENDNDTKSFRPYVKVELHVEDDPLLHPPPPPTSQRDLTEKSPEKEGEYKAKTKTLRGVDPDFGGEALDFRAIPGVVEELSFVRFLVKDNERLQRDDLAAWACVRLDRLRVGYRFVHLMDCRGRETDGVLLVKVAKKLS